MLDIHAGLMFLAMNTSTQIFLMCSTNRLRTIVRAFSHYQSVFCVIKYTFINSFLSLASNLKIEK